LIEDIINNLRKNTNSKFSYAKYYRKRGDLLLKLESLISEDETRSFSSALRELEKNKPKFPEDLKNKIASNLQDVKENFFYVFLQPDSHYILWSFNEIEISDKSLLSNISQEINKLSAITRGGINIYKKNGWMIHVLYGYQLINYNIPRGCLPDTINWPNNINTIFSKLKNYYDKLTPLDKIILNIGYFLHDIGVIDGVQNHSNNGPNHVPIVLKELNINGEQLKKYGIDLDYLDFEEILKILVENHTLINRVSGEYSDKAIINELIKIKSRLSRNETLAKFYQNDFPITILIIGIADFIAVDDRLLNLGEFKKIMQSYEYIQAIISGKRPERSVTDVALSRVRVMVKEKYSDDIDYYINYYSKTFDIKKDLFINIIYNINRIEYGIATLKPMNNPGIAVKILFIISKIIRYKLGVDQAESTNVIFDSSLDIDFLKNIVEKITPESLDRCIEDESEAIYLDNLAMILSIKSDCNFINIKIIN
jgi:hypothetical protein